MEAQLAVGGVLCIPFSFPKSNVGNMTEEQLGKYLERQANSYISRYGDARNPVPEALVAKREAANLAEMQREESYA